MIRNGTREQIQDDNNYIKEYGAITHICPKCGTVYKSSIKLSVSFEMVAHKSNDLSSYSIETPSVEKYCVCGNKAIHVDNAMGPIVKILIDKKYKVLRSCEGHAYIKDSILSYSFPMLHILGTRIPNLIPNEYFEKLNITNEIITEISCVPLENTESVTLDDFNKYKSEMLDLMHRLAHSLPNCPYNYDRY